MHQKISELRAEALDQIGSAADLSSLTAVKNRYLGRKGLLAALLKDLPGLKPEEKKGTGAALNKLKQELEEAVEKKEISLSKGSLLPSTSLDHTLPGKRVPKGRQNILTTTMEEVIAIFKGLGYSVAEGPEIETEHYNFEALNIPAGHPSRDMWSTLYIKDDLLLRTHTSPVQIRYMEKSKPPFAAIFPGKVFRRDAADLTHLPVFHQVEGLTAGRDITFADLKGTLAAFCRELFGKNRKVRLRPSYFPFTEPSAEVDVECFVCEGAGCRICKNTGWIEILGSGMVDPNVFLAVKYDPEQISGFAFGVGIERIAMLKYGIDDIRVFFENDLRVMRQF